MHTKKTIDASNIVKTIIVNRKQITIHISICMLLSILYCLVATPMYTAKTVINPPKLNDAGMTIVNTADLHYLHGGFAFTQKTDANIVLSILNTNYLKDMIVDKFNLIHYYDAHNIEEARHILDKRTQFVVEIKSGFIDIMVDDQNPKIATDIANYYTYALGKLISNVAYRRSNQKMQFFENQLNFAKQSLQIAQDKLKNFATTHGIAAGLQTKLIGELSNQLQYNLAFDQVKLQAMSAYETVNNPDYKILLARIASLSKQANAMSGQGASVDQLSLIANMAPEMAEQYADLMRNLIMNTEIVSTIAKQYEIYKVETISEIEPTVIQTIDPAQVPLHTSKPKCLRIVIGSMIVGFLLSGLYYVFRNRAFILVNIEG